MKIFTNKVQSVLAVLFIIAFILTACAKQFPLPENTLEPQKSATLLPPTKTSTPNLPTSTHTQPAYLEVNPDKLKNMTIRIMHPWFGESGNTFNNLVEDFNRKNTWGITATLEVKGGTQDLMDNLLQLQDISEYPHIAILYPYQAQWLDGNYFWVNLFPYLYHDEWGLDSSQIQDLQPHLLEMQDSDDQLIGFPALVSAYGLYYNRTWAQELGFLNPPKTPQDLQRQLCSAADVVLQDDIPENDGTGGLLLDLTSQAALSWFYAFGGEQISEVSLPSFDTPVTDEAFSYIKSLFDQSCAWIGRVDMPYDYFANRTALAYAGTTDNLMLQKQAFERSESQDEWMMIPIPGMDNDNLVLLNPLSYVVTVKTPEEQLASWLFIRWMADPDRMQMMAKSYYAWPVYQSDLLSEDNASSLRKYFAEFLPLSNRFYAVPTRKNWFVESRALQDAYSRTMSLDLQSLPIVLEMLDQTLIELNQVYDER